MAGLPTLGIRGAFRPDDTAGFGTGRKKVRTKSEGKKETFHNSKIAKKITGQKIRTQNVCINTQIHPIFHLYIFIFVQVEPAIDKLIKVFNNNRINHNHYDQHRH